ncbi:MAG: tyrosine-type recombinase/integrase [Nitrospira sp.]
MACVRKRRGKYVVDWRDGSGVRHWKTFHKKTDADAHRDKVGPESRQRLNPTVPANINIKDYSDHWKKLIGKTVKSRTLNRYSEILTLHILPRFEKVTVQKLDRGRIKLLLAEKLNEGLEKRTVRNIQAVLRAMLNAAIDDGLIISNPASKLGRTLKLTFSKSATQEEIKALTIEQRQIFLATAMREAPRYYPFFFVLAGTGMRLGEALALQAEDVDIPSKTIRIGRAFCEDGELGTPKCGHGRTVDISQTLTQALATQDTTRKEDKLKYGWAELPPWLFVTKAGTPLDAANVRKAMQSILKKAKLPTHFTPHSLRHTYASILLADGISPVYVQEQLGHATIELTVSTYGRWLKKKAPGALDRLDSLQVISAAALVSGSKVVASGASAKNTRTGSKLQLPEISMKGMELARGIEPPTCGLQISERGLLKSLKTWAILPPIVAIRTLHYPIV